MLSQYWDRNASYSALTSGGENLVRMVSHLGSHWWMSWILSLEQILRGHGGWEVRFEWVLVGDELAQGHVFEVLEVEELADFVVPEDEDLEVAEGGERLEELDLVVGEDEDLGVRRDGLP